MARILAIETSYDETAVAIVAEATTAQQSSR